MDFTFYFDESGDQGLSKIDPGFPVFVLCGIIFQDNDYAKFCSSLDELRVKFFGHHDLILHSRDIRKCEKEFCILLNDELKGRFYNCLNSIIEETPFKVIAAAIDKNKYIARYKEVVQDPYDIALSFVIERMVFMLDVPKTSDKRVKIIIEKRGKKEDRQLACHFESIMDNGTYYVSRKRLQACNIQIEFRDKKENINGLQLADLIAYPIARSVIMPGTLIIHLRFLEIKSIKRMENCTD